MSDAALKAEIARLTGAINQHKISQQRFRPYPRPTTASSTRDVVIDGVTFESSSRSLVRKGLPKQPVAPTIVPTEPIPAARGHRVPVHRSYKPKPPLRPQQKRPKSRNMTLDNTRRPQGRQPNKRMKYLNKPCPRFTTTEPSNHGCPGACSRGLTCMYQHDPNKIAICWNFLHGHCPKTAESCNLSHDPIPERTPLCVHFANNGRCTRENCPFPHVRVGRRHGVCRDFAVLGYCSKGLDCQMQHVRECPDFADKGTCLTKGCKLPHVIRANRNRKAPAATRTVKPGSFTSAPEDAATATNRVISMAPSGSTSDHALDSQQISGQDAQLGDEFISLTFIESESDDDSGDDATGTEDENEEEGDDPTSEDGPDGL